MAGKKRRSLPNSLPLYGYLQWGRELIIKSRRVSYNICVSSLFLYRRVASLHPWYFKLALIIRSHTLQGILSMKMVGAMWPPWYPPWQSPWTPSQAPPWDTMALLRNLMFYYVIVISKSKKNFLQHFCYFKQLAQQNSQVHLWYQE